MDGRQQADELGRRVITYERVRLVVVEDDGQVQEVLPGFERSADLSVVPANEIDGDEARRLLEQANEQRKAVP